MGKDHTLVQLVRQLGMRSECREFPHAVEYAPSVHRRIQSLQTQPGEQEPGAFVAATWRTLAEAVKREPAEARSSTFKQFAQPRLGRRAYAAFVTATGYSDFEKAQAEDAVLHYGFDDTFALSDKSRLVGSESSEISKSSEMSQWSKLFVERCKRRLLNRCSDVECRRALGSARALTAFRALDRRERDTLLFVPWRLLSQRLCERLLLKKQNSVVTRAKVVAVRGHATATKVVSLADGSQVHCRQVIMAVTPDALRHIDVNVRGVDADLAKSLRQGATRGQSFVRIYARVAVRDRAAMAAAVPAYTVVDRPLQTIIPMNPTAGVYMVAYSDNASAEALRRTFMPDADRSREPAVKRLSPGADADKLNKLCALLSTALSLPKVRLTDALAVYWKHGTHYNGPAAGGHGRPWERTSLKRDGVVFVGEAFSDQQGWVEGALTSVVRALCT